MRYAVGYNAVGQPVNSDHMLIVNTVESAAFIGQRFAGQAGLATIKHAFMDLRVGQYERVPIGETLTFSQQGIEYWLMPISYSPDTVCVVLRDYGGLDDHEHMTLWHPECLTRDQQADFIKEIRRDQLTQVTHGYPVLCMSCNAPIN